MNKTCNLYANSLFDIGATNDAAQPDLPECTSKGAFAWWLRRGRDSGPGSSAGDKGLAPLTPGIPNRRGACAGDYGRVTRGRTTREAPHMEVSHLTHRRTTQEARLSEVSRGLTTHGRTTQEARHMEVSHTDV